MQEKKPYKTVATVALFMLVEPIAGPLIDGKAKHDLFLIGQPHTHQGGAPGSSDTGKIEIVARVTTFAADFSGLRTEDNLRAFKRN